MQERRSGRGKEKSSHKSKHPHQRQASIILTRLLHGAKGKWREKVKQSNKVWRREEKEKQRKERETVKVGAAVVDLAKLQDRVCFCYF